MVEEGATGMEVVAEVSHRYCASVWALAADRELLGERLRGARADWSETGSGGSVSAGKSLVGQRSSVAV